MTSHDGVSIFSSLRYDPILLDSADNTALSGNRDGHPSPLYMFTYHSERLLVAADHFGFSPAAKALCEPEALRTRLEQELETYHFTHDAQTPLKVRVEVFNSQPPRATVGIAELPKVALETLYPGKMPQPEQAAKWEVIVDTQATIKSEFTRYKTNRRKQYDAARERAGITGYGEPKEVILWNEEGEIMEASVAAVFVKRGDEWWGMRSEAGGLGSTVKRWLTEKRFVRVEEGVDGRMDRSEVKKGDWVVLGNGARGIWGAWVR